MSDTTEKTVQVPVSLIERFVSLAERADEAWANGVAGDFRALLSQPTPSAETEHDESCIVWTGDGFHCDCGSDDDRQALTPPRIEDMASTPDARLVESMAPNTTFTARIKHESEDRWARLGGAGVYVMNAQRQVRGGWLIDPSTIRDVTPPTSPTPTT